MAAESLQLEIIKQLALDTQPKNTLLFVHGGWHGAWCWQEHFMPYFAQRGYNTYAFSLRGHGASEGTLRQSSLVDYTDDLYQVIKQIEDEQGTAPVVIGHSMGAIVTLLYASQGRDALPPRLVLLAPAWSGTSTLQTILQSLSIISAAPIANARAFLSGEWHPIPARMLFSEATTAYFDRLQNESVKALSDLIALQSNANFNVPEETPVFFFAGEVDSTVPYESVTALRDLVGHGELAVIPRATHDMMLSPHVWQQIADRIIVWLENSENQ